MATTTSAPNPILTYVGMALALLGSIATGGLKADVGIAQSIEALIVQCVPLLLNPSLGALTAVLAATAAVLQKVNDPAAANDAQIGIALVGMVQAAAAAVTAQSGAPIDPTKVPQLPPFVPPAPPAAPAA